MESSDPKGLHAALKAENFAKKEQKFEAFDFLRAIFSVAIVAYKTKIFYIPKILLPTALTYGLSDYILSGMVGALAVPVFLQISLFLFNRKSENTGLGYFIQKRLPRLISLYLFWVILITVFDILFIDQFAAIANLPSSIKQIILFIISGNNTPYFFFFSLIFVTILSELLILLFGKFKKTHTKTSLSYGLLIASCIFVFTCSALDAIVNSIGLQSSSLTVLQNFLHWDYNPLNFLPYIFTAAITAQEYNQGKLEKLTTGLKRKLYVLSALTFLFFAVEWIFTSHKLLIQVDAAPLDHYLRLSLVFGSWLLLYLALLAKQSVPASIKFLSACSLGIYGFHVFFTYKRPLPLESLPFIGSVFQAHSILQIVAIFLITLLGSIALTLFCKKSKTLKGFV